jgi:Tfp pilus assembly pilus retraction ATPase PilT
MTIEELIQRAVPPEASDLHLVEGYVPRARLHGALRELQGPSISEERFTALLYTLLADDLREAFTRGLDVDTARSLAGERWRIHGYTQRAGRALSLRRIPNLIDGGHFEVGWCSSPVLPARANQQRQPLFLIS